MGWMVALQGVLWICSGLAMHSHVLKLMILSVSAASMVFLFLAVPLVSWVTILTSYDSSNRCTVTLGMTSPMSRHWLVMSNETGRIPMLADDVCVGSQSDGCWHGPAMQRQDVFQGTMRALKNTALAGELIWLLSEFCSLMWRVLASVSDLVSHETLLGTVPLM